MNTALGVAIVMSPVAMFFGIIAFAAAFAISRFVSVGVDLCGYYVFDSGAGVRFENWIDRDRREDFRYCAADHCDLDTQGKYQKVD